MNENPEKTASPRRGLQNVAALTSVYGGVSPTKKTRPPMSPYMERQLSENRKGGFSSPPMSKQKVYRSPVKAAPVVDSGSDDSDSDDEAKVSKPPKPGSFEDSFNKLMASSSSYDEVESDSDDDDSDNEKAPKPAAAAVAPSGAAAAGVGKGDKVRSTPVKSTSTDPNAYSSSDGVSGSEDEDDNDSSSSSDSSESDDDDDSASSHDDSDDSSISSSSTSSSDGHPIVSQPVAGGGVPPQPTKLADKELEEKEAAVPATKAVPAALAVMAAPAVLAVPEPKPEPAPEQQQQQQQSRAVEESSSFESHDEDLKDEADANKKAMPAARFSPPTNSAAAVPPNNTADLVDTEGEDDDDDEALQHRMRLSDSEGGTTDESPEDDGPYQSASEHLPHSIDGMENLEVYMDTTESDRDDKSQISHDTPFVKDFHGVRGVNSDEFEDEPISKDGDDEHHAIQVESPEKAFSSDYEPEYHVDGDQERKFDEHAPQELQKEDHLLLHYESAAAVGKGDDVFSDEEHGSQAASDLSDGLETANAKRSRRRRCILILSCLACIMLLAIAYIFVWIFVIRKNNENSGTGPVDVKQLVGEIFGNIASAQLGSSVAVSGSGLTVAVGAPDYEGLSVAMGQVRVLSRQGSTLSDWAQIGQLLQGDQENDAFGSSIVLSGDGSMLAVGSAKRDGFGYVRVFNLTETNQWQQAFSDIVANQTGSGFGATISASANGLVVAVGAPSYAVGPNSTRTGGVSMYGLFDNAWRLLGEPLVGQGNGDGFGTTISLSSDGRIVAIGSPGNSLVYPSSGLVQVFEYNIPGNFWQQKGSNIKGEQPLDRLGVSVALSSDGQTVAIGMVTNDSRGGMVRVYQLGSDSVWSQVGNGVVGEQPFGQWGYSVAISNDGKRVVSGSPLVSTYKGQRAGRVRVFDVSDGAWQEVGMTLEGKGENDNFGQTVSISGDGHTIVAGAPNFTNTFITPNGAKVLAEAGYAQVYEINN